MHYGDSGITTSTCGMCVMKDSKEVQVIAMLDHLVSLIGMLRKEQPNRSSDLRRVQEDLYACINHIYGKITPQNIIDVEVSWLESLCGPFKGFDIPGDSFWGVTAHMCRTYTRVCEQAYCSLNGPWQPFLNRLSSYFYTIAIE